MATELTVTNSSPRRIERGGRIWPPGRSTQKVADARVGEVRACRHLTIHGDAPPDPAQETSGSCVVEAARGGVTTEQLVAQFTADELRAAAEQIGVSTSGAKADVADRIVTAAAG